MTQACTPSRLLSYVLAAVCLLSLAAGGAFALVRGGGIQDGGAAAESVGSGDITVFLLRHGEKSKDDPRDPSLSEAGHARAQEVARVLGTAGVTHLFSTDYKRTRQTLEPLATRLGLEIGSYDAQQPLALFEGLPNGAVVAVSGHSNTTPGLYSALGAGEGAGLENHASYGTIIPGWSYDRLYCLTLERGEDSKLECRTGFELRYGAPSAP